MAKAGEKRPIIKLRSTAGTGFMYTTRKNKTNTRERLMLHLAQCHVLGHQTFTRFLQFPCINNKRCHGQGQCGL